MFFEVKAESRPKSLNVRDTSNLLLCKLDTVDDDNVRPCRLLEEVHHNRSGSVACSDCVEPAEGCWTVDARGYQHHNDLHGSAPLALTFLAQATADKSSMPTARQPHHNCPGGRKCRLGRGPDRRRSRRRHASWLQRGDPARQRLRGPRAQANMPEAELGRLHQLQAMTLVVVRSAHIGRAGALRWP